MNLTPHEPATAGEIMRRLLLQWDRYRDLLIPRCCALGWEADLLVIRRSGWAEEVEIKVSLADYRAEFRTKAAKHEDLALGGCRAVAYGRDLYPLGGEYDPADPRLVRRGDVLYLRDTPTTIRRFWFAMPASLAERLLPEIPQAYGVLAISGANTVLREPTNLKHARKLTPDEQIKALRSAYQRFWALTLREPPTAMDALCHEEAA